MHHLIEFSVANFRSFKERATLSMLAAPRLTSGESLSRGGTFSAGNVLLSKCSAIYGANASGKSNLMRALGFMRQFVRMSVSNLNAPIPVEPFRLSDQSNSMSLFEVVFFVDGTVYRYGFEVDSEKVGKEWLFQNSSKRERRLFTRTGRRVSVSREHFREGVAIDERTRENSLFLTTVAQFNGAVSTAILEWFTNRLKVISGLEEFGHMPFTLDRCSEDGWRQSITDFVRNLDVGVEGVRVTDVPVAETLDPSMPPQLRQLLLSGSVKEVSKVSTTHTRFSSSGDPIGKEIFDLSDHESSGTQKVFGLSGPFIDSLRNGRILAVDELDAHLHPLITQALIKLFTHPDSNFANAQLIFTTHDVNLLNANLLRRDQFWFADKNRMGESTIFSMLEFSPRSDESFSKRYLEGRYGAVPALPDLTDLFDVLKDAKSN